MGHFCMADVWFMRSVTVWDGKRHSCMVNIWFMWSVTVWDGTGHSCMVDVWFMRSVTVWDGTWHSCMVDVWFVRPLNVWYGTLKHGGYLIYEVCDCLRWDTLCMVNVCFMRSVTMQYSCMTTLPPPSAIRYCMHAHGRITFLISYLGVKDKNVIHHLQYCKTVNYSLFIKCFWIMRMENRALYEFSIWLRKNM